MPKPPKNGKKNPVRVAGPWLAMPLDFLRSRACAELSPHAAKMLLDLCAALGPNAKNNGDLSAAPAIMKPKGWVSNATRVAALNELEAAGLISLTRRGNRGQCALYAVTLWHMDCDHSKLDHGPGSYTTTDWQNVSADRANTPTTGRPAKWKSLRKNANGQPVTGKPPVDMNPLRDNLAAATHQYEPATGTKSAVSVAQVIPPWDTSLDSPSAGVGTGASVAGIPRYGAVVGAVQGRAAKLTNSATYSTAR